MHDHGRSSLSDLVAALPEIYQPIFSSEGILATPSRTCEDRVETIVSICSELQSNFGRPLNVLDLGCAQGFFSFHLAKIGAKVKGIDYLPENIAVCKKIQDALEDVATSFVCASIEDFIETIRESEFDVVLGLSVFHHLCHSHGQGYVEELLTKISLKVPVALIELALKNEPLYWAESLPADPREFLGGFAFVHEVSKHATHLSAVQRPIFFASNCYWYLNSDLGSFDKWTDVSHRLAVQAHAGTRRYFFSRSTLIKLFRVNNSIQGKLNLAEIRNESVFLENYDVLEPKPLLVLSGENENEAWLVREIIEGKLLSDLILDGDDYDARNVINEVLAQLCKLESVGLYHNDLRVWNVLIRPNEKPVILDYGAISPRSEDNCWPTDLILNFIIFIKTVMDRKCQTPVFGRQAFISPWNLPSPYDMALMSFWRSQDNLWSFDSLSSHINSTAAQAAIEEHVITPEQRWFGAIERRLDEMTALDGETKQLASELHCSIARIESELADVSQAIGRLRSSPLWKIIQLLRRIWRWTTKFLRRVTFTA